MLAIELKNDIKGSKSITIEWIDELWHFDFVITNEMKFNSFIYSGISKLLDGSEDDQFREY